MRLLAALALSLSMLAVVSARGLPQVDRIDSIVPQAGRPGDAVTITGLGFGARNLQVTVAGLPASLVTATGSTATFVVPQGTPAGVVPVVATNPGGQKGEILFRVIEGVLLGGNPAAAISDALTALRPIAAPPADVDDDGVILTRLDVRLTPDATVGQLNAALTGINGGIAGMQPGVLSVVVAVPRLATAADLRRQAELLEAFPGIRMASAGRQAVTGVLPFTGTDPVPDLPALQKVQVIHHLLPSRFPAAWNAAGDGQRLLTGCRRVPVIVQDYFGQVDTDLMAEFPAFAPGSLAGDGSPETHGFDVMATLAANFDAGALTGANPFQQCLDLRPLSVNGISFDGVSLQLAAELRSLPTGKAVVNQSLGFRDACATCVPMDVLTDITSGLRRAYNTMAWKEATADRWNDFAIAGSAGNNADEQLVTVYAGLGLSRFGKPAAIAATSDPFLVFAGQGGFFQPPASQPEYPSLAATVDQLGALASDVARLGLDLVPPEFNAIIVGSTTSGLDPGALTRSSFSDWGADVHAVGEGVLMSLEPVRGANGTSFAAPQVAGLMSYLWLLSPELRDNRSSSEAVRAIRDNARTTSAGLPILDAYAAVLSLDGAVTPATAPIRVALLDLDGNGSFTDDDLGTFVAHYFDDLDLPVEATVRDYSQFDLNGDGFTGGDSVDRFDLDRAGSIRFGRSIYSAVEYDLGGARVSLNENSVTDLQILCYYAYSPLYVGSHDLRETRLANHCGTIGVAVNPATVTLAPGATQQFAATVIGTTDPSVTWVLPDGGGAVSSSGFFTAGTVPGTYVVRAISAVDPGAFGDATVTIGAAVRSHVFIAVGGPNAAPGYIRAGVFATGFDMMRPISERDAVIAALTAELSRVSIMGLGISMAEPIALSLTVGDVGYLSISAACGGNVDLTAGNVRRDPANPGLNGNGQVDILVCESTTRLQLGVVDEGVQIIKSRSSSVDVRMTSTGFMFVGSSFGPVNQHNTVKFNTASSRGHLTVVNNLEGSVELTGAAPTALNYSGNVGTTLNAGTIAGNVTITQSNLQDGLSALTFGNVAGNLAITSNRGFTNEDAQAFAQARQVGGTVTVSGNIR